MPAILLESLSKRFGPLKALDGIDAELPGGAMGLLGPNGAGKTTLLKTLLGLLPADSGRAEVLGVDAARAPIEVRRRVGYMPEADCTIPGMKGVRLVAFAGQLSGLPRRASLTRASEVLFHVGLGEVRYRNVDEYSQGMRQRLRLAQALVHDPDLLFLDEPTSGLDPKGRREMLTLIKDLAENHGKEILLSTHLLPDVEEVCGHVLVLNRGRVATCGPLADLLARDEGLFEARIRGDLTETARRLRDESHDVVRQEGSLLAVRLPDGPLPLFAAARAAGAQIRELREVSSSLEEALIASLRTGEGGD